MGPSSTPRSFAFQIEQRAAAPPSRGVFVIPVLHKERPVRLGIRFLARVAACYNTLVQNDRLSCMRATGIRADRGVAHPIAFLSKHSPQTPAPWMRRRFCGRGAAWRVRISRVRPALLDPIFA